MTGSKAKEKEARLRGILEEMGSCLIAFSGGVDSAYLALIAHEELGQKALAVTAESPSYPAYQKVFNVGFRVTCRTAPEGATIK